MWRFGLLLVLNFSCLELLPSHSAFGSPNSQTRRSISGRVIDSASGKSLVGANVVVQGTNLGAASDANGRFVLRVSNEAVTLSVRHIGYQRAQIRLRPSTTDSALVIALVSEPIRFPEVNVRAEPDPPLATSFRLQPRELQDIPDFTRDPVAAVKLLPAVTSNNETSSGFSVQGGSPDENLILLEGVEITRPQRVRHSAQESFTPLNRMLVQSITFTAGSFPARYGERLSSVLMAKYRTQSERTLQGEAELSLMNAGVMLEGQPNENLYWAVSGRVSDRRLLLGSLQTEGDFAPRAYDVQAVLHYDLSSRNHLLLMALHGVDSFDSQPQQQMVTAKIGNNQYLSFFNYFTGHEDYSRRLSLFSAQLTNRVSPKFTLHHLVTLSHAFEHEDVDKSLLTTSARIVNPFTLERTEEVPVSGRDEFRDDRLWESGIQLQSSLSWLAASAVEIETGARFEQTRDEDEVRERLFRYTLAADSSSQNESQEIVAQGSTAFDRRIAAAFANAGLRLFPQLRLDAGLRLSYYELSSELIWQPRVRLTFEQDKRTTLSAAWGRYAQPAGYHEMRVDAINLREDTPAQRATHWLAALHHSKSNGDEWDVQFFYKNIDNLIPYRMEDIFVRYEPWLEASGTAYGMSTHWRMRLTPRWTSWLSYTYMIAQQEIQGEGESRLPTDQRHTATAMIQDEMPNLPRSRFHLRVLWGSGYPFATTAGTTSQRPVGEEVDYGRDLLKMGPYRRIDLGMSYLLHSQGRTELRASIEVFNVFDYRNLLTYLTYTDHEGKWRFARVNLTGRFFSGRVEMKF